MSTKEVPTVAGLDTGVLATLLARKASVESMVQDITRATLALEGLATETLAVSSLSQEADLADHMAEESAPVPDLVRKIKVCEGNLRAGVWDPWSESAWGPGGRGKPVGMARWRVPFPSHTRLRPCRWRGYPSPPPPVQMVLDELKRDGRRLAKGGADTDRTYQCVFHSPPE